MGAGTLKHAVAVANEATCGAQTGFVAGNPSEQFVGVGLLQDEVPHQFGIHGILEEQHHVMTRMREEVSTRMPRPEEIVALYLRPGVPVLDVRR